MAGAAIDEEYSSDGRIRRGQKTRQAIVAAASRCFASQGYNQTSIREIAELVGVDKALIIRYFGSKEKLFIACIDAGIAPRRGTEQFTTDPATLADRVAGIDGLDAPYAILLACVRSAGDEQTNNFVREVFEERMIRPNARAKGDDVAMVRTALIAAFSFGLLLTRNVMGLSTLREMDNATLAGWLEPVFAQLMAAPGPGGKRSHSAKGEQ